MRRLSAPAVTALVLTAALVAVLAYGVVHQQAARGIDRAVAAGARPAAPSVRLPRLDGRGDAALADWRGRVVVVNFWASWCGPCRDESPLLERWHRRLSGERATVLGVDALDVDSDARAFARQLRLTYPMLRDRDGSVARRFGVRGYPETVVLDRRGHIAAVRRGPVDAGFMRRTVEPLLRERV